MYLTPAYIFQHSCSHCRNADNFWTPHSSHSMNPVHGLNACFCNLTLWAPKQKNTHLFSSSSTNNSSAVPITSPNVSTSSKNIYFQYCKYSFECWNAVTVINSESESMLFLGSPLGQSRVSHAQEEPQGKKYLPPTGLSQQELSARPSTSGALVHVPHICV